MDKNIFYHIPWIIWLGIILVLSLLPGDQLPTFEIDWLSIDTLVHIGMYFGFSGLLLIGFHFKTYAINLNKGAKKKKMNVSNFRLYGLVILAGILVGYSIELIQGNFIFRRYFDMADVVANFFGTIFGVVVYSWTSRKLI